MRIFFEGAPYGAPYNFTHYSLLLKKIVQADQIDEKLFPPFLFLIIGKAIDTKIGEIIIYVQIFFMKQGNSDQK